MLSKITRCKITRSIGVVSLSLIITGFYCHAHAEEQVMTAQAESHLSQSVAESLEESLDHVQSSVVNETKARLASQIANLLQYETPRGNKTGKKW